MARLNSPWNRSLSKKDFENFPLWVWDDENKGHLPISDSKYTTEYGILFIKSLFETEDRHVFDGYLVGFDDFYAFNLFTKNDAAGFNVNLPEFIDQSRNQIYKLLKCNPFPLFPLRYKSPIDLEDGDSISGKFVMKNGELFCVSDVEKT